jgi:hypothetical protein
VAGQFYSSCFIVLEKVQFPEFGKTIWCEDIITYVFDDSKNKCKYNFIAGHSFLKSKGFKLDMEQEVVEWNGIKVTFKPKDHWIDSQRIKDLLLVPPF